MPLMTWSEQLSVNVQLVDDQHKRLVDLVNYLHDAMKQRRGAEALAKTLSELVNYTVYHFSTEEGLFSVHKYPEWLGHKHEHEALTKQAKDLSERCSRGEIMPTTETMTFLRDWLKNHILGSDKKYGPFLNSKGVF
jgi:hemerythrin